MSNIKRLDIEINKEVTMEDVLKEVIALREEVKKYNREGDRNENLKKRND